VLVLARGDVGVGGPTSSSAVEWLAFLVASSAVGGLPVKTYSFSEKKAFFRIKRKVCSTTFECGSLCSLWLVGLLMVEGDNGIVEEASM
jgi:hypothetical protein